jgi:hypothetical protein
MIYVLKIIWDYRGAAIRTYRPQYRSLSAIRYLDANPLPTRSTLFSTLGMGALHLMGNASRACLHGQHLLSNKHFAS